MYNEDTLVQATTADYLLNELNWDESIFAMDEVFGREGTLGRSHDGEVVLTRLFGREAPQCQTTCSNRPVFIPDPVTPRSRIKFRTR